MSLDEQDELLTAEMLEELRNYGMTVIYESLEADPKLKIAAEAAITDLRNDWPGKDDATLAEIGFYISKILAATAYRGVARGVSPEGCNMLATLSEVYAGAWLLLTDFKPKKLKLAE